MAKTSSIVAILIFFVCHTEKANAQLFLGATGSAQVNYFRLFDQSKRDVYRSLPSLGYNIGLTFSTTVRQKYFLTGSVMYASKGRLMKSKNDMKYNNVSHFKYLELPLTYTFETKMKTASSDGKGGLVRIYKVFFGGGPTISYWLGGKGVVASSDVTEDARLSKLNYKVVFNKRNDMLTSPENDQQMNVEHPNRFQFSLNFTAGIAFEPASNQRVVVAARLEVAQTFCSRTSDGYFKAAEVTEDPLKGKLHSLQLSVSYLYDTKISERLKGKSTKDKLIKKEKKSRRGKKKKGLRGL